MPESMSWEMPAGACDSHCHVFGPTAVFPYAPERTFTPEERPKEALFALHAQLGIERCVVVQSNCHGFDNAVVADVIRARPETYRGVALLPVDVDDATLAQHARQGFRGVRFNFMKHLGQGAQPQAVIELSQRLAAWDWHLQIHCESGLIEELTPILRQSAVPVVIDHIGRVDASLGPGNPHFQALCRLLEDPKFWVKVSGCDRASRQGPPYDDAVDLARLLVQRFPERVLWGTDWPHPNVAGAVPDDWQLRALLPRIAPTPELRERLLVSNPAALYHFGPGVFTPEERS